MYGQSHWCQLGEIKTMYTRRMKEVTENRVKKTNLPLVLQHQKVPLTYNNDLINMNLKQQGQMAGMSMDRPASFNDVEAFEELLRVRLMVVRARLENTFITSPCSDERPCIYVYLVDDDHYNAITSITGFFSCKYFCETCLKPEDQWSCKRSPDIWV